MSTVTNPWRRRLEQVLVGLPVLSLALAALAWLRYGIDLPWFDDWRGYAAGTIDSLELDYLFQPMNDTMSPVGLALDALAQRFLDGNSVAYQFLSMVTVLGSLLVLQWKLLSRVMDSRLQVAVCFLFTILMLQPDSYWGLENLAYYQALPLVFILCAMLLMSGPVPGSGWRGPAAGLLGLLAGFAYISGAFGAFAVGVTSLLLARRFHSGTGPAPPDARLVMVHGRVRRDGRGAVLFLRAPVPRDALLEFRWRCPSRRSSGLSTSANWGARCCCRRTGPGPRCS